MLLGLSARLSWKSFCCQASIGDDRWLSVAWISSVPFFLGQYTYADVSAIEMNEYSSNTLLEAGTTPGTIFHPRTVVTELSLSLQGNFHHKRSDDQKVIFSQTDSQGSWGGEYHLVLSGSASYNQEKHPRTNKSPTDASPRLLLASHCNPSLEITAFHQERGRYWHPSTHRRLVSPRHWYAVLIQSDAAAGIDKELLWWVWKLVAHQSAACCLNIQNSPPRSIFSRELPYLTDVPNE